MDVKITNSVLVKPPSHTRHQLWLSNLDLVVSRMHTCTAYIYRPNGDSHLCVWKRLRDALSKVLLHFYPLAGRMTVDSNGRLAIDCNGEGALFLEAVTDAKVDDLGNFGSPSDLKPFVPSVTYTDGFTTDPLLLLQVTKFKCGGVAVGVAISHTVSDGMSSLHFVNTWCDVARELDVRLLPVIDRTALRARNPPSFHHPEFEPAPPLLHINGEPDPAVNKDDDDEEVVSFARLRLSREQVHALKTKARDNPSNKIYSTNVVVTAHIWKCCCAAQDLKENQETKLYFPVDGRKRLRPPMDPGFFGNVIFLAAALAVSGDIVSNPLWYTAAILDEEASKMDDEYLRSHLGYLESQPDLSPFVRNPQTFKPLTFTRVTSWIQLPIYEADFGWGKPIFMGPTAIPLEGTNVLSTPQDDGSLWVCLTLQSRHMTRFRKIFYQF